MSSSFTPIKSTTNTTSTTINQVRAIVTIQRCIKRWLSRKRLREQKQNALLHASVTENQEKLKRYKSSKVANNFQSNRQKEVDLSGIVTHEKLKNIIPVPLPELPYLKQQLPLNHFRSIGRNNYLISLNDPKDALFAKISNLFTEKVKLSPGKSVKIHRIQIIWNQKQQEDFLKLEQYYTNMYSGQHQRQASGDTDDSHANDTDSNASTSEDSHNDIVSPSSPSHLFTPLQQMYTDHLKQFIFDNPSKSTNRYSNVITTWFPINDERKQEYIAKHGILMRDRTDHIDDVTTLPRLYGDGLYFQTEKGDDLDEIMHKYRIQQEREQMEQMHRDMNASSGSGTTTANVSSSPANGNAHIPSLSSATPRPIQTPIKKLVNSSEDVLSNSLASPRTPRTPRGTAQPITFVGCFLLAGKPFPLTNVKLHGFNVRGYDSTYVRVRQKDAEAAFCSSYEEYEQMKRMGSQLFPIEDVDERTDSDQLVLFDERAILPQFFVTCTVERNTRINSLATNTFKRFARKKLKQVILTRKKVTQTEDLQVDQYDTLPAALDYGEKIIVLPGTYEADEVMLSKTQLIKGSNKDKCVLSLSGHMVIYNAVSDVTIRCSDPELSGSINIFMLGETALLKNCKIEGVNVIVGSGKQERLITSCIFTGNASIEVKQSSILTIQRSRVGCSPGIIVKDEATCHLVQVGVDRASVSVQGKARFTANQNTIFKRSEYSIVANDTTDLELNKVTFKEIRGCAIYCLDECEMTLNDCNFINCPGTCMQVKNLTLAKISHTIFKQCGTALECLTQEDTTTTDGACIVSHNTFVETDTCLRIRSGKPKVHTNKFLNCASSVTCGGHSSCDFRENVLHNSPFLVTAKSVPIIKMNQFTTDQHDSPCMIFSSLCAPIIKRNTFGAPHSECIIVRQSSHPVIHNNTFLNSFSAITIQQSKSTKQTTLVSRNTFRCCKNSLKASCQEPEEAAISKRSSASPLKDSLFFQVTVEENHFEESELGILASGGTTMKIKKNNFSQCTSGISLDEDSNVHIKKCSFVAVRENAIVSFKNAQADIRKNEFGESDSRSYSVHVRGESNLRLEDNTFYSMNGIHVKENSSVHLLSNMFLVQEHAVTIGNDAFAHVEGNTFEPIQPKTSRTNPEGGVTTLDDDHSSEASDDNSEVDETESLVDVPDLPIPETPREPEDRILLPHIKPLNMVRVSSTVSSVTGGDFADALCIEAFDSAKLTVIKNTFCGENKIPNALYTGGDCEAQIRENHFSKFTSWACHASGHSKSTLNDNIFMTANAVQIEDDLSATVVSSNKFDACHMAIMMQDSSEKCEISSNHFTRCEQPILVGGAGQISKNEFDSSLREAIRCIKRSTVVCRENTFSSNDVSISVEEQANPQIMCNIFDKHNTALIVKQNANCTLRENEFLGTIGVTLWDDAKCQAVANTFSSSLTAFQMQNHSSCSLTENIFNKCDTCIDIYTEQLPLNATLELPAQPLCSITGNTFDDYLSAVSCHDFANVVICRNTFNAGRESATLPAIALRGETRGSIADNSFDGCLLGVSFLNQSVVQLTQNKFANMKDFGCVYALEHSVVNKCFQNTFANSRIGVSIVDHSCVNMKQNTFSSMIDAAIVCRGATQTLIDDMNVEKCPLAVHSKAAALVNIGESNFDSCHIAIRISDQSGVSLHDSSVSGSKFGVLAEHQSFFIAFQVDFSDMLSTGMYLTDGSNSIISGCQFFDPSHKYGIYADSKATGRIFGESVDPYADLEAPSISIPPIIVDYSAEDEVEQLDKQMQDNVALLTQRIPSIGDNLTELTDKPHHMTVVEHDVLALNRNQFLNREDLLLRHRTSAMQSFEVSLALCAHSRFEVKGLHTSESVIGILLADHSESLIEDCHVTKCDIGIAAMTKNSSTVIQKNKLQKNKSGIVLGRNSRLVIAQNKLSRNTSGLIAQGKSEVRANTLIFNRHNIEMGWDARPVLVKNKTKALCSPFPWFFQFIPIQFLITSSLFSLHTLLFLYFVYLLISILLQVSPFSKSVSFVYWFAVVTGLSTTLITGCMLAMWNCLMMLRKRLEFDFTLIALILTTFLVNAVCGSFYRVAILYDTNDFVQLFLWVVPCLQILFMFLVMGCIGLCSHIWCLKALGFRPLWFFSKRPRPLLLGDAKKNPLMHEVASLNVPMDVPLEVDTLQITITPPTIASASSVLSPEENDEEQLIVVKSNI